MNALANEEMKIVGNGRSHMLFASMAVIDSEGMVQSREAGAAAYRTPEAGFAKSTGNGAMSVHDV